MMTRIVIAGAKGKAPMTRIPAGEPPIPEDIPHERVQINRGELLQ
jgi:hypothetical protein